MEGVPNIEALIRLIDDPDDAIFEHVRDRLLQYGPEAIPYLENSWETQDFGLIFHSRIENLIHEIQFEDVKVQLEQWYQSDKDLLRGAIIVAKYQYPGINDAELLATIQQIRKDIWLELNAKQTAYEKVRIFNKVFFGKYHFHGDAKTFHSPLNSYINTVLESHKGNPLSLSIVYSIVAQSLNLPIYGVNLPNHFILAYMDEDQINPIIGSSNTYGVLFYINPFAKGSIFDENEIREFLKGMNIAPAREHFEPCPNTAIIRRMITNLITAFQQVGNSEKVQELILLRGLLD